MGLRAFLPLAIVTVFFLVHARSSHAAIDCFVRRIQGIVDDSEHTKNLVEIAKAEGYRAVSFSPSRVNENIVGQHVMASHSFTHEGKKVLVELNGVVLNQTDDVIEVLGVNGQTTSIYPRHSHIEQLFAKPTLQLTPLTEKNLLQVLNKKGPTQILLDLPIEGGDPVRLFGSMEAIGHNLYRLKDARGVTHEINLKALQSDFSVGNPVLYLVEGDLKPLAAFQSPSVKPLRILETREQLAQKSGAFKNQPASYALFEQMKENYIRPSSNSIYRERGDNVVGPIIYLRKPYVDSLDPGTVLWDEQGRRLVTGVHKNAIARYADNTVGVRPDPKKLPESAFQKIYPSELHKVFDEQFVKNQLIENINSIPKGAQAFDLQDVLSVVTNQLRGDIRVTDAFMRDHPVERYNDIMRFLAKDPNGDILNSVAQGARSKLMTLRQYPELKNIPAPPSVNDPALYRKWYEPLEKKFGKKLVMISLAEHSTSAAESYAKRVAFAKSINPNIKILEFKPNENIESLNKKIATALKDGVDVTEPFKQTGFTAAFRSAVDVRMPESEWLPLQDLFTKALNHSNDSALGEKVVRWVAESETTGAPSKLIFELLAKQRDGVLNESLFREIANRYLPKK